MRGLFHQVVQQGHHLAAAWVGYAVYDDFVGIDVHLYLVEFAFRRVCHQIDQFRMAFLLLAEVPYHHGCHQA